MTPARQLTWPHRLTSASLQRPRVSLAANQPSPRALREDTSSWRMVVNFIGSYAESRAAPDLRVAQLAPRSIR